MAKPQAPETTETLAGSDKEARLASIMADLATYDGVELPPGVREWLDGLVGCVRTPFSFDPETYFDEQVLYD